MVNCLPAQLIPSDKDMTLRIARYAEMYAQGYFLAISQRRLMPTHTKGPDVLGGDLSR